MSETKKYINDLISYGFKKFFQKEKYKKSGIDFIKKEESTIKIVSFWPGHSNVTISLGIFFPEVNNYITSKYMDNNPKRVADCHVQQQNLGFLTDPKKAKWWDLYDTGNVIDLEKLSLEIFETFIKYGFPWLNGCNTCDQALDYLLNEKAYSLLSPLTIPSLYLILGEKEDAKKHLENSYSHYIEYYSDEALKEYRDALNHITQEYNEFANKNSLDIHFVNKLNE